MIGKKIKNVFLIVTDDLRAKNLGIYGKKPSPTPEIDKLGKSGIVFENAYCSINKTDPSVTSIMTGLYPLTLGLINQGSNVSKKEEENLNHLNPLAQILKKNGFKTIAIDWLSRWHETGFDYYSGKISKSFSQKNLVLGEPKIFFWMRLFDKLFIKILKRELLVRFYYAFFPNPKLPYDDAKIVVDKTIEIFKRNKAKNLFFYLHFWDAHLPYTRPTGLKSYIFDNIEDTYNSEINYIDVQLSKLMNYLSEIKQLNDTLFVITSDHGENFHEFGMPLNHEDLHEQITHVPLILWGSMFTHKRIGAIVQHVDILPTILDVLNIKTMPHIDGKSLLPLVENKVKQIRNLAYFTDIVKRMYKGMRNMRRRGIREGNYKLIQTFTGNDRDLFNLTLRKENVALKSTELYNLKKDPLEKNNLADSERKIARRLSEELEKFSEELNRNRLRRNPILQNKIKISEDLIKKIAKKYNPRKIAIAWTGGKDSTVLLHIIKNVFHGNIPFKVIFNDSTMEFAEVYSFIKTISEKWKIPLITIKHDLKELREFHEVNSLERKKELSRLMKITAINKAIKIYNLKGFVAGIRWDEHEARSKEKYVSNRKNHIRIHPILHFTEKDIWDYIDFFGVPFVNLYKKGYRSLGEKPFTKVAQSGGGERSGRDYDKEKLMIRLRKLGYW